MSGSEGGTAREVTIRAASARDVPAVHAIESASFADPWTSDSFDAMLARSPILFRVAERGDVIVGYVIAWIIQDEGELINIAVDARARGERIGALLLDSLLREFESRGGHTLHLEVREGNAGARGLYGSRDFVEVGRRSAYYRNPVEDALIMRRTSGSLAAGSGQSH